MKITRKLITFLLLTAMTLSAMMSFSFGAGADYTGSYDLAVTSGRQYSEKLSYGGNYIDCKLVSEGYGDLTLNIYCEEQLTYVYVTDFYGNAVQCSEIRSSYGTASSYYNTLTWDPTAKLYSGTLTFRVDKGTYYIRFLRDYYSSGTGNLTFTATYPTASVNPYYPYYCCPASQSGNRIYYDESEQNTILKYFSIQMPAGVSFKFGVVASGNIYGTVKWSSSNKSAVKVSSKGKITTVAKGQALITAQYGTETIEIVIDVVG